MKKWVQFLFKAYCLCLLFVSTSAVATEIHFKAVQQGSEIIPFTKELARISNIVFTQYPYLYPEDDEQFYITRMCHSSEAKLCLAYDGPEVIGYAVGVPLKDYRGSAPQPHLREKIDREQFFYLAEIAILPAYRQQGIGSHLLQQFEALVVEEGRYPHICLVSIEEETVRREPPEGHRSVSYFWPRFGYTEHPELAFTAEWPNVGETEPSSHTLIYWIKPLFKPELCRFNH